MAEITYAQRILTARDDDNKDMVLIAALRLCHQIMNNKKASARMRAKAHDVINTPEAYKDRFSWSVAAIIDANVDNSYEEAYLDKTVLDVFDAMAGEGLD